MKQRLSRGSEDFRSVFALASAATIAGSSANVFAPIPGRSTERHYDHDDNSNPNETGVSRRATLGVAAGVAALGVAAWHAIRRFRPGQGPKEKMDGKAKASQKAKVKEGRGKRRRKV